MVLVPLWHHQGSPMFHCCDTVLSVCRGVWGAVPFVTLFVVIAVGSHVGGLRRKHWSVLTEPDSRKDGSLWCAGGDSGVLDMVFERRLFRVFELSLGVLGSCLAAHVAM